MYKQMTWKELSTAYCKRQEQTPDGLLEVLKQHILDFNSDGFMLLECQVLDSSRLGEYTILGFGGRHTYKEIPNRPISPRGLASDMSMVKGWISRGQVETADNGASEVVDSKDHYDDCEARTGGPCTMNCPPLVR